MPFLLVTAALLAGAATPALAESLQGNVLAGRSVQAQAAARKAHDAAPSAAGQGEPNAPANPRAPGDSPAGSPAAPGQAASPGADPHAPDLALGPEFGIGGVRVTVVDNGDPKSVFATRTGADGRFALNGIPAGNYRVTFAHGALGERSVQAMVGKGAGELVFVWETAPGRPPGDLPLPTRRP